MSIGEKIRNGGDLISRQAAIDAIGKYLKKDGDQIVIADVVYAAVAIEQLPSAQPQYEPVTAEDFAKTMSENTLYGFMAWYGEAFTLIKEMGFEICKKTM